MPPQLPPPPPRPVLFDVDDRPSSPTACEDQLPVACEGLELTVYGLNRDTSRSAVTHLRQVLHDLKQSLDRDPARDALYDAVVVRAADTRQAVDYAYVSLSQERVPQPRADLLQDLRKTLLGFKPSLRVLWRTQPGPDRTRRVFFFADSKVHADNLRTQLDAWLENKGYASYLNYTSCPMGTWRVTFDLLDPTHVDALFDTPPVIGSRTYAPGRPRFIIPSYGYQVVVLNCRDWMSAQRVLDAWIRQLCHESGVDPVVHSAMEHGGEVYTAVLPSWADAVRVADGHDDLVQFLRKNPVTRHIVPPDPGLLYALNGIGLYLRQSDRSSSSLPPEFVQFRREFEYTHQQGVEMMSTIFHCTTQNTEAIKHLGGQMNTINANSAALEPSTMGRASVAVFAGVCLELACVARLFRDQHARPIVYSTALSMSQTLSNQLLDVNMSLADARRDRSHSQMFLLQRDLPANVSQYHLEKTRECEEQIGEYTLTRSEMMTTSVTPDPVFFHDKHPNAQAHEGGK
ncbi:hypothetical protein LXA43DRAFT_1099063 [Ganoderma leucocontextum]|nr:hypothetical protein LXA43DRAFT_1099063 [Ganoderma leucocontextum]